MIKQIISFFNTFLVLPCCYMLFNKKALLVLNNATAHLEIEFFIRCSWYSSKSFIIDLIFVALDNCTCFGIVTSVFNFANCQLTHCFVERESEVDTESEVDKEVERNLSCHKMLYDVIY